MRERDLQSMCRKALLLTVCMVSLWVQLSGASSHRSHIGTTLHVMRLFLCFGFSRNYYNSAHQQVQRFTIMLYYNFVHMAIRLQESFESNISQKKVILLE